MEDYRNKTKKVQIGNVCIGGGERIARKQKTWKPVWRRS